MPANIEIKARVRDFADLRRRAEAISDFPVEVIPQEDTFFLTPKGRLKLRVHGFRPRPTGFIMNVPTGWPQALGLFHI